MSSETPKETTIEAPKATTENTEAPPKESKKLISLRSSDGETYEVEEEVANVSQTIKNIIEDGCGDESIPLPNVSGPVLAKVIEYSTKHAESATKLAEADLKAFDAEFVKLEESTLFELILAANYLNIKDLLDLTCQTVADKIKDMTVEEVRALFHITNDFTPEEEEAIRNEHPWAFE